jgi:hypothetical protein
MVNFQHKMASPGVCSGRLLKYHLNSCGSYSILVGSERPAAHHPRPTVPLPTLGLLQYHVCCMLFYVCPRVILTSIAQSIEAVAFWKFAVATCFLLPKILLHTFIGARIAALSDGHEREKMDTGKATLSCEYYLLMPPTETKIVNGVLIGGGILLALVAGG